MKQQRPVTIANGRLVTPDGLREGNLRLVDGMIDAIDASAQDGVVARHSARFAYAGEEVLVAVFDIGLQPLRRRASA